MNHCIVCTEYPPAHIPPGGIGTYAANIARLLAEAGETVHVIGRQWPGAPDRVSESCNGRLIVHRVPMDEPLEPSADDAARAAASRKLDALRRSEFSEQCFAWQVAVHLERLVDEVEIDVIEAQEINAPLYYFLLRRALGLGPRHEPPCIVHLHSSSEQIVSHNEWDAADPYWITAKRFEDYCIGAADALLCPSRFLARETEEQLGLSPGEVTAIPLPTGDTPRLERSAQVWESGPLCYVGRLEPRKGVIEWVDAAVSIADDHPDLEFEFVGADLAYTPGLTVQNYVAERIPAHLRERFHFRGSQSREGVMEFLAGARAAVVPSRWENFPNTCVEAMSTGLPVIASPSGGMAEMLVDGESGWITASNAPAALAEAARRALATPPERLAAMGERAAADIGKLCDNDAIVARHLAYREQVHARGTRRSRQLPACLADASTPGIHAAAVGGGAAEAPTGVDVIVDATRGLEAARDCLTSLEHQTVPPRHVQVIVPVDGAGEGSVAGSIAARVRARGWSVYETPGRSPFHAQQQRAHETIATGSPPLAFAFVAANEALHPSFTETCESVLAHANDVGIASMWVWDEYVKPELRARPCPSFPYQLVANEVAGTAALRAECLDAIGRLAPGLEGGFEQWQLVNRILAHGWKAVTIPEALVSRAPVPSTFRPGADRMYRKLVSDLPEVTERHAEALLHLVRRSTPDPLSLGGPRSEDAATERVIGISIGRPRDLLVAPTTQKLRILGKFLKDPRPGLRFAQFHLGAALARFKGRSRGG